MEIIDRDILDKVKTSICQFAESIKADNNDLYNRLIDNWKAIERLFLDFDKSYNFPMLKPNFSSNFAIKMGTLNGTITRLRREGLLIEGVDIITGPLNRGPTKTYIHESGAKRILERSHTSIEGTKYLLKIYGIRKFLSSKLKYISILHYAVKGIDNPESEYKTITDHKIDLYLQIKKLAIECDEHGHSSEPPDARRNRQEAIKNSIGCIFLRFNPHPHSRDFDIGFVIKVVLHYLFNKLIDGKDPIDYFYKKYPEMRLLEIDMSDFD